MKFPSLRLALIAGLALPLGLATASTAQTAPPAAPAAGMRQHWDPAQMRAHMAEHLRAVLQLQPSQDAALDAFLDAMKPTEDMHQRMMQRQPGEMAHLTTPERLDKMLAHLDQRRAAMIAHVAAIKQFYAQLSPSQQKAFDVLAPMMMHHHAGDWGHGGEADHGFRHGGGAHPMGPGGMPQG